MKTKLYYEETYGYNSYEEARETKEIQDMFNSHIIEARRQLTVTTPDSKSLRKKINKYIYFRANGKPEIIRLLWVKLKLSYSTEVLMEDVDNAMDRVHYKKGFLDFVQELGDMKRLSELAVNL